MNKGVVLLAFGKVGYAYAAYNMALSIKYHNPNIKIAVICDDIINRVDHHFFDNIVKLSDKLILRNDPGEIKVNIYKYLPFKKNLYLDVDGICLKDVAPLMDELDKADGYYLTEVKGYSGKDVERNYSIWAKDDDIWNFFGLDEDSVFPAIQSSYAWIEKNRVSSNFFKIAQKFYEKGFDKSKLTTKWGKSIPDELIFGGACAKAGLIPNGGNHIFFGLKEANMEFHELTQRYYINSIYGNGIGNTLVKNKYLRWYENLIQKYCSEMGVKYKYILNQIKRDKYVNYG